eukprot:SAG31_NODE_31658_length_365_cov_1.360902_1_plen_121_part_11
MITWTLFASLLYLTECNNDEVDAGRQMRDRFASVPQSMPYTLILLSGDYPLINFSFYGKVVNFFMIIVAQAVVAIPTAITISSFTNVVFQLEASKPVGNDLSGIEPQTASISTVGDPSRRG